MRYHFQSWTTSMLWKSCRGDQWQFSLLAWVAAKLAVKIAHCGLQTFKSNHSLRLVTLLMYPPKCRFLSQLPYTSNYKGNSRLKVPCTMVERRWNSRQSSVKEMNAWDFIMAGPFNGKDYEVLLWILCLLFLCIAMYITSYQYCQVSGTVHVYTCA